MKNSNLWLVLTATAWFAVVASGANVTVSTPSDVVDGNTTSIANLIASPGADGKISLREAVLAANNTPGANVITVPAGTYNLGNVGTIELQPGMTTGASLSIAGAGPGVTVVHQTIANQRVFDVDANTVGTITVTLSGMTISGGTGTSFGGGAILAGWTGDVTTVSNCTITANGTSGGNQGGGIGYGGGGNLIVASCTFSNNTSDLLGGAIAYNNTGNAGTLTISNSVFVANTANNASGALGGAVYIGGVGPYTIRACTFLNNTNSGGSAVNQHGGAIDLDAGSLTLSFCRIFGNQAGTARGLYAAGGATTTATDNWWGGNSGPGVSGADDVQGSGSIATSPYLILSATVNPATINTTGSPAPNSTTITASFLKDSANNTLTAAQVTALTGTPVTWSNAQLGTLSFPQNSIQAVGTATTVFTAGTAAGTGHATVAVDNAAVTVNITIDAIPSITLQPTNATACENGTALFTAGANGTPAPTVQWQVSTNGGTTWSNIVGVTSTTLSFDVNASQNGNEYRAQFANSVGTTNTSAATLTVYRLPIPGTDILGTTQSVALHVSVSTLLANDTDPNGFALSITGVSATSTNGAPVSLAGDTVTYTPLSGFTGRDQFTYTLSDGTTCPAQGTVVVVVTAANTSPYGILTIALSSGRFLTYTGVPSSPYYFQAAGSPSGPYTNLSAALTAGTSGKVQFTDTNPSSTAEYYRVKSGP